MSDDKTTQDPPKPFTDEQIAALSQIVNSAVTSQLKRAKPATEDIAAAVKASLTKEALSPILEAWVQENDAGDAGGTTDTIAQVQKQDPQIAALQAKLAELTQARENDIKALEAEKVKARDEKALAALRSELAQHIRQDGIDVASSHLFLAEKRITFDDNGNPLFVVKRAPFAGAAEEEVAMPLTDGVQAWLKSPSAKMFLPPPGTTQTEGARPGQAPRRVQSGEVPRFDKPATSDAERAARVDARLAAYSQKFPGNTRLGT